MTSSPPWPSRPSQSDLAKRWVSDVNSTKEGAEGLFQHFHLSGFHRNAEEQCGCSLIYRELQTSCGWTNLLISTTVFLFLLANSQHDRTMLTHFWCCIFISPLVRPHRFHIICVACRFVLFHSVVAIINLFMICLCKKKAILLTFLFYSIKSCPF